jgi:hypothetical protein
VPAAPRATICVASRRSSVRGFAGLDGANVSRACPCSLAAVSDVCIRGHAARNGNMTLSLVTSNNESATDAGLSHVFVWTKNLVMFQKQGEGDAPDSYLNIWIEYPRRTGIAACMYQVGHFSGPGAPLGLAPPAARGSFEPSAFR